LEWASSVKAAGVHNPGARRRVDANPGDAHKTFDLLASNKKELF
jgi:hypothetical protein